MIHNILFDLDGTLTDPKNGITRCIQYSLDRLDRYVPSEDQLLWCIGPPLRQSFSQLLESNDESLLERAMDYYRERFSGIGIYENTIYPGIFSALESLHAKGLNLYLATSKPTVFATRILNHFGLTQFFRGVYGSQLDGRLSEKAELVAHILSVEALDPLSTLIVGDRLHDVVGGKTNGIATAMVSYGYGGPAEIDEAQPDLVFAAPSDLAAWAETTTEPSIRANR
jgi:phosphoglycolate phosphatase